MGLKEKGGCGPYLLLVPLSAMVEGSHILNHFFQPLFYLVCQHFSSVLDAENKMVEKRIFGVGSFK